MDIELLKIIFTAGFHHGRNAKDDYEDEACFSQWLKEGYKDFVEGKYKICSCQQKKLTKTDARKPTTLVVGVCHKGKEQCHTWNKIKEKN